MLRTRLRINLFLATLMLAGALAAGVLAAYLKANNTREVMHISRAYGGGSHSGSYRLPHVRHHNAA